MKEFLAKQALKIVFSMILIPVTRYVLMPALVSQSPNTSLVTNELGPISLFDGTGEFSSMTASSQFSDQAQKKMQEAARQLNNNSNGSVRFTTAVQTTADAKKPASQPQSKAATVNQQPRVAEVNGHKMLINPGKSSVNSVVIQPSATSQPTKCPPGRS